MSLASLRELVIGLTLSVCMLGAGEAVAAPPNIVIVLIDDLGVRDTGCYGSSFYETPNIDRLADDGMRFTRAYANHPRCIPSRAGLMTGRFPAALGCPGGPKWRGGLPSSETTFAEALRVAGYRSALIGKWHLCGGGGYSTVGMLPEDQGFDHVVAATEAGLPRSYFAPYDGPFDEANEWRSKKAAIGLEAHSKDEYLTERLTDEAIGFIERHVQSEPDRPFLVVLSHYAVHQPIDVKRDVEQRYQRKLGAMTPYDGPEFLPRDGLTKARQDDAGYAAMVESIDDSVGSVTSALDRLGLSDSTVVIFTSDHGGLSNKGPNHGRDVETSNLPFRAGKGHLYEGGLRVPLIVRWPGEVDGNSVVDEPVVGVDLFPTLVEIAGIENDVGVHDPEVLDGVSFTPLLFGGEARFRPAMFWHSPRGRPGPTGDFNSSVIIQGEWKLVRFYDRDRSQLFHLGVDPYETSDLAAQNPDRVESMSEELGAWLEEVSAPAPSSDYGAWGW